MEEATATAQFAFDGENAMNENTASTQQGPSENQVSEAQFDDEVRLRQFTEDVLDCRQEELEEKEKENVILAAQIESLQRELNETKRQLSEARNHVKSKSKQLREAKDQIFSLQPSRKDMTESEALEEYKRLRASVRRWVEARLTPILNELDSGRLESQSASPVHATRFTSFIRESGRKCTEVDQSDEYHVTSVIMNYLWQVFFNKSFYCPLDDSNSEIALKWVDDVENAMSRLPRDAAHCREWRIETITTLTNQPSFKTRRTAYLSLVSDDLASILSAVAPKSSFADLRGSVHRSIVEPAADLAHQLHLTPNVYSLKWPAKQAWNRLEVYECSNLAGSGTPLDLSGTNPSSPARRRVVYLFDVAPGLFVERIELGKKMPAKAICKPNVLVYAADSEVAFKPTVMSWLGAHSNRSQASSGGLLTRTTAPKSPSGMQPPLGRRK